MDDFLPNSKKMENGKRVVPIVSIVCNFTKPTENAPALLTFDEVSTFFFMNLDTLYMDYYQM